MDEEGDLVCLQCGYRVLAARSILDEIKGASYVIISKGHERHSKKMRVI